ncbi:MAG: IS5/IS1182 family transposase, partial [Thermostichus sp. DG02_5_bins_236]
DYYSGKHKYHTLKDQVRVEQGSGQIICTSFGKGRRHDFRLFKESKTRIEEQIEVLVDKEYMARARFPIESHEVES